VSPNEYIARVGPRCSRLVYFQHRAGAPRRAAHGSMNKTRMSTPTPDASQAGSLEATFPPVANDRSRTPGGVEVVSRGIVFDSLLKNVFSFPAMLAAFLVGAVYSVGRTFSVDPDLWWHIRTGQIILATKHWPTVDSYSFTVPGQPWIAGEWIGDVLIATAERLGGLQGLDLLLIALASAVMLALYGYATIRGGNSKSGLVVAAVLFILANASFSLRPQMLGYLFLVLTMISLERFHQGKPRAVYFLPLLFLVWVNTHGSFVIGIGSVVCYLLCGLVEFQAGGIKATKWTDEQRRTLEIVLLLSVAVLPITPYGSQLAMYPFHVAGSLPIGVANVAEWQPMPFNLFGGKFFLALVLVFFVSQMARRFSLRLEELVLLLGGTAMACLHVRFLLVFVPFFVPALSMVLAGWIPGYERAKDRYVLNAILMAALVVGMVHYFPSRQTIQEKVASQFPVKAVEYLQHHDVAGPMLNSYGFGGYLVWANRKVFVDGRADPYERGGSLADYFHITRLKPGTLKVMENYGIQSCLLDRSEPLVTLLAARTEWQQVYSDDLSILFVKKGSSILRQDGDRPTVSGSVPGRKE
jgi:hypothetical protein